MSIQSRKYPGRRSDADELELNIETLQDLEVDGAR